MLVLLALAGLLSLATGQIFFSPPLPPIPFQTHSSLQLQPQQLQHHYNPHGSQGSVAHRAVIENSLRESQLPPELSSSNHFYRNPKVAAALAKDSWFTDKEMPVFEREAEKIPRDRIFKIFKNAGWIKRR